VRHGETDWSARGRHSGTTDLPLNARGRRQAEQLGRGLAALGIDFAAAWTSPLARARETAALAGFPDARRLDELREWDYGEYEGTRTDDVRREEHNPGWLVWTAAIRHGETVRNVGDRADAAISALTGGSPDGDVIVFSHGHFLRILAARWMGMAAAAGQHLALDTGMISVLGREHEYRVIDRWNAPLTDQEDADED
jgi:broad specificity phosphatase PhoE